MSNKRFSLGMLVMALAALLILASCPIPTGGGGSSGGSSLPGIGTSGGSPVGGAQNTPRTVTYESKDSSGNTYTLTITGNANRAAYSAEIGDSYEMKIVLLSGETRTSRGTIQSIDGNNLTLMPSGSNVSFVVTCTGGNMTAIAGTIITCVDGETVPAPTGTLTPVIGVPNPADNGTPANPFIVDSAASLAKVGTGQDGWTLSACYLQTADIALRAPSAAENNHIPIGAANINIFEHSQNDGFTGSYDGGGYTISGLAINTSDIEAVGLFGHIGPGGTVKNITLTNVNFTVQRLSRGSYCDGAVGGVAGLNEGTVENCSVTGRISGSYTSSGKEVGIDVWIGGVVGQNTGTVANCYNTGNIKSSGGIYTSPGIGGFGSLFIGGVIGQNTGTVANCSNSSEVNGFGSNSAGDHDFDFHVGGVVGMNGSNGIRWSNSYNSTVKNCYNTGNVEGNTVSSYTGGVVGTNYAWKSDVSIVENNYSTGNVTGITYVCGVVGQNYMVIDSTSTATAMVRNCYSTGRLTSGFIVTGIGTNKEGGCIHNCVALNPSITTTRAPQYGMVPCYRITDYPSMTLDNRARADMLVYGKTVSSTDPTSPDGADLAIGSALSAVFAGFSPAIWNIPVGNLTVGGQLPTLRDMPGRAQYPTLP